MVKADEEAALAEHLLRSSTDRPEHDEADARSTPPLTSDDLQSSFRVDEAEQANIRKLLYTSHFLSTWNSRLFEFGAFLFLANIFPQTLLPASLYALCRNASAAVAAPWIGSYIDRADRLVVVRISIGTIQRVLPVEGTSS
jgi:iron-regulated transporter 1